MIGTFEPLSTLLKIIQIPLLKDKLKKLGHNQFGQVPIDALTLLGQTPIGF